MGDIPVDARRAADELRSSRGEEPKRLREIGRRLNRSRRRRWHPFARTITFPGCTRTGTCDPSSGLPASMAGRAC